MRKLEEVREFLNNIGMPMQYHKDICCYTLLALMSMKPDMQWEDASGEWIRIHDMIQFVNSNYGTAYAENTRERFRKQALHPFRMAALVEDNGESTNSPNFKYRLTKEVLILIRGFHTEKGKELISDFLKKHKSLIELYESRKKMKMMPVRINGTSFNFSSGDHNKLQKAILEEFASRFAPYAECLYVGDTIKKDLVKNENKMAELGFEITLHDKMPDIILYCEDKRWIYFVESVTSGGPMSSKRVLEIEEMTKNVTAGKIYITAFLDFKTYKKFSGELSWETEVWIAELPEHMIHLNGDKFMGPRLPKDD